LDKSLGSRGITAFLVEKDTPGFSVGAVEKKMGLNADITTELIFEDCRLPASQRLGQEGEGFKIAMSLLDGGRIGIAAQGLGIAQGLLTKRLNMPGSVNSSARPFLTSRRFLLSWPIWLPALKQPGCWSTRRLILK
jgi:butyryl-CoA dehydrogenase